MDRISHLPDPILHHILSFCNTPLSLVRMSVLSKTWFHLTASFPILYFHSHKFRSRESFFKHVEYTTSKYCHQNLTALKLRLVTTIQKPVELNIVNRCLKLLLKNGVRVLVINLANIINLSDDLQKYRLPNILLSVSVLESLIICGYNLPSSLTSDTIKFKSLTWLVLKNMHINDEAINHLTTNCPLLQVFHIRSCRGFKRFYVYGHQHLQNVWIEYYNSQVERIAIDAPNLSNLSITKDNRSGPPQMNLASCKKLKTVTYYGQSLPKLNDFTDFLSNFPFIENLVLSTKYKYNGHNLKLSSHSLKTLVLYSHCYLEEIELITPNLVSFSYTFSYSQHLSMEKNTHGSWLRDSTDLKARMYFYPDGREDILWFEKLRHFLDKKNGFKAFNLYIHAIYSQKFAKLGRLKAIELPPYELEHVELQLESDEESFSHIAFVDAVLWCCRPRSLTLRSSFSFSDFEDVIKFTYKKLLEQEDQGRTNIQVAWPSSSKAQKHSRDLKSMSMPLPYEGNTVSFIKEEVVQEEAR